MNTRTLIMVSRFALGGALLMTSGLVLAGPPFMTDDPEPVDYQHHEFYIASQQTKTSHGRSGTLPHFEFNYGAAHDLMIHIVVPYAFNSPGDGPRERGPGDVELGIKYRLVQESDSHPMVGIFPIIVTQTGDADKGLGSGATQVFLPVWIQKRWGDWQSYGGGGYLIDRAADAKNHWFFGWQLQKDLSDRLTLGGEIFHITAQTPDEEDTTAFNVGGTYNFDQYNHLLFSIGQGITNVVQTNKFSSYVAYQRTW